MPNTTRPRGRTTMCASCGTSIRPENTGLASMREAHCHRLLKRISGGFHQPIADGRFGDYQLRLRRVVFDLFAQMRDMNAKVMCLLDRLRPPNVRQKLAVR